MKRIVLLVAMLAMMALLAAPALAAPQGQVEQGPEHARSICSFSGLNDFDPEEEPPYDTQVQSYGQRVKQDYKGTEFAPEAEEIVHKSNVLNSTKMIQTWR